MGRFAQKKYWQSRERFCHSFALKFMRNNKYWFWIVLGFITLLSATGVNASEADIHIPPLDKVKFDGLGGISGAALMYGGIVICLVGALFGVLQYKQTKALPVHKSMADVS